MREIKLDFDGQSYLIVTKEGKTELGIKGHTTPEADNTAHNIKVPNIMIITRKNADVLFVLKGGGNDSFKIITAQKLYDDYQYQWFEPLADNYREMILLNKEDYIKDAYKIFSWSDIVNFSLIDRPSYSFYKNMEGDWKQSPQGGAGYLLVLVSDIPYWTDAIGQIPFAIDTFRDTHSINKTVEIGISWGTGTLTGSADCSNEYDNYFVLRGAIYASKRFSYSIKASGQTYPAVVVSETNHSIDPESLGASININELHSHGIWKK